MDRVPGGVAHPFDDGTAALLERSLRDTAATIGGDGAAWLRLMRPLVRKADVIIGEILGPLRLPRPPLTLARFGLEAILPATRVARRRFQEPRAKALFAGLAAHSMLPLTRSPSAAAGLVLALLGHHVGWPFARGGSQAIADALSSYLRSLGGEIETRPRVELLDDLPRARLVLADVTPRQLADLAGRRLPARYRRRLLRYRYGPGVFKLDLALDGPIPWRARSVHAPRPFTSVGRSRRSPRPKRPCPAV